MTKYHLDVIWTDTANDGRELAVTLTNLSDSPLSDFSVGYTSITRTVRPSVCQNGTMTRRQANYHEYAPPAGLTLAPGESWRFVETSLSRKALHSNDGPKSAFVIFADGSAEQASVADMQIAGFEAARAERSNFTLGVLPQPASFAVASWMAKAPVHLKLEGGSVTEKRVVGGVNALARRLFTLRANPFVFVAPEGAAVLRLAANAALAEEAYQINFNGSDIVLTYGTDLGLRHGLVTLAQGMMAAREDADRFAFPHTGRIEDAPRHVWRGSHLDVSRQVYPLADILRFVDILAWHKLNRLHWHLTDDEGWRLEIKRLPQLTEIGAHTGLNRPVLPQLGHGPFEHGTFYTQDQARAVVAHGRSVGVEVMPEIDLPGHCAAAIASLPDLVDPDEPESYWSIQGYGNNALNPALDATWTFTQTVLEELLAVFPFEVIHVGGDEVAPEAWLQSPKAQELMARERINGTDGLQAHYLKRVHAFLSAHGRITGGWEEVAHGGGVSPDRSLLFAWTLREKTAELAALGYDVVSSPGQTYYLDMVQSGDWNEPGASWAGITPVETSYGYEAQGDDPHLAVKLKGIQACIWSEHITSRERFNHQVFPRLPAIAEAAWSPEKVKDFARFSAIVPLMPKA